MDQEEKRQRLKHIEEVERKKRIKAGNINQRDPKDVAEMRRINNMRTVPFKDSLSRAKQPCYQILDGVPENFNHGAHNPNFKHCDKDERAANFTYHEPVQPQERLRHVSPCVLDSLECSHQSRIKAKRRHMQVFNSILQVGHQFFDSREHNEQGKFVPDPKIKRIRANVSVDDRPVADARGGNKDIKAAAKKGSTFSVAQSGANVS